MDFVQTILVTLLILVFVAWGWNLDARVDKLEKEERREQIEYLMKNVNEILK